MCIIGRFDFSFCLMAYRKVGRFVRGLVDGLTLLFLHCFLLNVVADDDAVDDDDDDDVNVSLATAHADRAIVLLAVFN